MPQRTQSTKLPQKKPIKRKRLISAAKKRKLLKQLSRLSTLSRINAKRAILLASVSSLGAIGGVISLKKQRTKFIFPSIGRLFSRRTSGVAALSEFLKRR